MPRPRNAGNVLRARRPRSEPSLPEALLWRELKQAAGKFRRQHPLGPYVLDFYCAAAKMAVEIDGTAHDMGDRPQRDTARDAYLAERGVKVIRIAAVEVLKSPNAVAENIVALIAPPPPR